MNHKRNMSPSGFRGWPPLRIFCLSWIFICWSFNAITTHSSQTHLKKKKQKKKKKKKKNTNSRSKSGYLQKYLDIVSRKHLSYHLLHISFCTSSLAANGLEEERDALLYKTMQDYGWLGGSLDLLPEEPDSVVVVSSWNRK